MEQSPGPTRRLRTRPLTRSLTMPNGDIACLLKFAPKEAYIDGLMDGHLIGIVRYDRFEQPLNWDIDSGDGISLHGSVLYGAPTPPQHSPESSLMLTGVPVK